MNMKRMLYALAFAALAATANDAGYPWQQAHAKVLPNGDLEWAPEPFKFEVGKTVRYIDYEAGNDANDGASKGSPWKHHPWDAAAKGKAKAHSGPTTYVFKRGSIYRGALKVKENGTATEPIRLTSDPSWGEGEAMFYGSRKISGGWKKTAHPKMPEAGKVWAIDLDTDPRTVWMLNGKKVTRIDLARDPNWTESNPQDPMSEWYVWDNPKWWTGANQTKINGKPYHWCTDKDKLKGGEDLTGATVWSQWMPVMSSPYPHPIVKHDRQKGAIAFGGPWIMWASSQIWQGCRYYLEDMPQWLDSPGEFWFDKKGKGGKLYIRLPGDADPNKMAIEVGEYETLIDSTEARHLHISGLAFRFTDWYYDYPGPQWHPSREAKQVAIFRLNGGGEDIVLRNNTFEHVSMPVRIVSPSSSMVDGVTFNDNVVRFADNGVITISAGKGPKKGSVQGHGKVDNVTILRNRIYHTGFRVLAGAHGHTIHVNSYRAHIAGNMIERTGGWGINVSGFHVANGSEGSDVPYCRYLIHHNRVKDCLLKSCDWGAFYITNHGGAAYLYSNIAINPVGNRRGEDGRLGMAYYLDGGYKCYLFNNIAVGHEHNGKEQLMNKNAFKSMVSFQNTFFNNTVYRWANASDRQSPQGNREKYIGNIFADINDWVFYHNKPKKGKKAANAHHEVGGEGYRYETMVYSRNVIHDVKGQIGIFVKGGKEYADIESMRKGLAAKESMDASIGVIAKQPVMVNPDKGDYRLRPGSAAIGASAKVFVPWQLARTVGEWNFRPRADKPSIIEDEHWYQTSYYVDRGMYRMTPRYPLVVAGATRQSFTNGLLESWIPGALKLAEGKFAVLSHAEITKPFTYTAGKKKKSTYTVKGDDKQTVDIHDSNLLIEAYLRSSDASGVLVRKMDGKVGYELSLNGGKPQLVLMDQAGKSLKSTATAAIADGNWHHLIVEVDRKSGVRFYIDGKTTQGSAGNVPQGSLSNSGDFLVGGGPDLNGLAMEIDFLRVARGTLAEAGTSIDELYAWQFNGPQFRDFTGKDRGEKPDAGALQR